MTEAVERVSANYRYIGAYNELNSRIAQRQQALAFHGAICTALIAGVLSGAGRSDATVLLALLLVLPAASFALALLNYRSERLMANLRSYLAILERLGDAATPAYNADAEWLAATRPHRRFYDFASACLASAASLCLLVLAAHDGLPVAALMVAGAAVLASIAALLVLPARGARMEAAAA